MLKKISIIIVLSTFLMSCNKVAQPVTVQSGIIEVSVDPRVELIGIICYLAGYEEYQNNSSPIYASDIDAHFQKWKSHKVVNLMKEYRDKYWMGYSAPMGMAIHLSNEKLEPLVSFEPFPERLDIRWQDKDIDEFTTALKHFREVTDFDLFFESNTNRYRETVAEMEDLILRKNVSGWLLEFFGESDRVKYSLIVSEAVGWANYGCSIKMEDFVQLSPVVGKTFNDEFSQIVVHEFAHGYANSTVGKIWDKIGGHSQLIFEPISEIMVKQVYGTARSFVNESVVRSITGVFVKDQFSPAIYESYLNLEVSESFNWVPGLTELFIDEYKNNRDIYSDLDSFSSRIVEFVLEQDVDAVLAK